MDRRNYRCPILPVETCLLFFCCVHCVVSKVFLSFCFVSYYVHSLTCSSYVSAVHQKAIQSRSEHTHTTVVVVVVGDENEYICSRSRLLYTSKSNLQLTKKLN